MVNDVPDTKLDFSVDVEKPKRELLFILIEHLDDFARNDDVLTAAWPGNVHTHHSPVANRPVSTQRCAHPRGTEDDFFEHPARIGIDHRELASSTGLFAGTKA